MRGTESEEVEGKIIIIYFSAAGNTVWDATLIAEVAGGELIELDPIELYIDVDLDWTDENSCIRREYEGLEQREIKQVSTMIEGWGNVLVVYVSFSSLAGNCSMASE